MDLTPPGALSPVLRPSEEPEAPCLPASERPSHPGESTVNSSKPS